MEPDKLKVLRKRFGLTQAELAGILRIEDQRTVRRWEAGDRAISGPATILLELMDSGELPQRYWNLTNG